MAAALPRLIPRFLASMSRVMRTRIPSYMKMVKPRQSIIYGGFVATAFGASYMLSQKTRAKCDRVENIELLNHLRDLAPVIDAKKMLKLFLKEFNTPGHQKKVTEDFVIELFYKCGIEDAAIPSHLFKLMDWNNNGILEPEELAATFTLFQVGTEIHRFKFLFHCLDLDESHTVDKQEFRGFVTALLAAKYRLSGLRNYKESDELYMDISYDEYRTIAKITANALVREIFLFADANRDGELNMKEFLHWCKRGGAQVAVLKDILNHVCDDAMQRDVTV